MASGDTVNAVSSIASGAYLTYQPGAGVSSVITELGSAAESGGSTPNKTPAVNVYITEGSNYSKIIGSGEVYGWKDIKVYVDNTNYLAVKNEDGSTQYIGYSGVEL